MKNFIKIGCFGIVLFLLCGCYKSNIGVEKKYVAVMPPITTTGENTMGCYVNGKLWVAFTNPQFFNPTVWHPTYAQFAEKSGGNNRFYLKGYLTYDRIYQVVDLSIILDKGIGKYIMQKNSMNDQTFVDFYIADANQCAAYQLDEATPNYVEIIHLDLQKNIASGKFEMTVFNQCGDTLKFTDGRFDVVYQPD